MANDYQTMKVYEAEFQSGLVEGLSQNVALFNEGTKGAIRLVPRVLQGHYSKEAFFKDVSGLVIRRDITSVAAATDLDLTQDEFIGVKINRTVGPVLKTLDAIRKAGITEAEASRAFGKLAAQAKLKDMINTALIAAEAAIQGNTAMNLDITGESTKTASTASLNRTLAKFGDMADQIVFFVIHSKPWFDITGGLITDKVTGLSDLVQLGGTVPAFLGRGFAKTDAPALTDANGSLTDTYNTLALVEGAVVVEETEPDAFVTEVVTGLKNLARRWQSEHAFNIKIKGFKYDVSGGINPTDGTIGTTGNWDKVASHDKMTAGVRLVTQ